MAIRRESTSGRHTRVARRTKLTRGNGRAGPSRLQVASLRGAELGRGVRRVERGGHPARELGLEVGIVAMRERGLIVAENLVHEDLDELGVELGARDAAQLGDRGG